MKKSAAKVSKPKPKVKDTTPKVDQLNPGFSFRWPEKYDFSKYADTRQYSRLPKSLLYRENEAGDLRPGLWADLPLSAKAVLIVLLRHANKEGVAFPSEEIICAKSGINSRKTARGACRELQAAELLQVSKYITKDGRRANRYRLSDKLLSQRAEDYLAAYHHHIEAGYWAVMGHSRPSAQALYWAIRLFAKPRPDMDEDGEWLDLASDEGREWLMERDGDVCKAEPSVLCDFAGINPRSYRAAMDALKKMELVQDLPDSPDSFFVHFRFGTHYTAHYLNSILNIA